MYTIHPILNSDEDSPPANPPTNGDISTFSTVDICPANPPVNDLRVNIEPRTTVPPINAALLWQTHPSTLNPPPPTTVPVINNEDLLSISPNDTGDT